jgi:uncharacterized protein (TIGR03437 family)
MLRQNLFTSVGFVFTILFLILGDPKTDEPSQLLRQVTTTSDEVLNLNPSLSGDGRFIAFESTLDLAGAGGNGFHAVLADLTSQVPQYVQIGSARAVAPAMSQNGSMVAFSSTGDPLGTNADGNSEIFLFRNGGLVQITSTTAEQDVNRLSDGNFQPSISDDGRYIAFSSNRDLAGHNADGNLEIFVCDTIDLSITQLTNTAGSSGAGTAKISGDGNIIAYVRDGGSVGRDLILQNRLGLQPARVVAQNVPTLTMAYGRTISDDGSRVVYSTETSSNASQVFLWDGRNQITRQLTELGVREEDVSLQATISGDGTRVSFATRRGVVDNNSDHSVDLYLIDVPTAHLERVTNAAARATAEVVSSLNDDGSIVAFSFPRVLTNPNVPSDLANSLEIYAATISARPQFGEAAILNGASFGRELALDEAISPSSIAVARGRAFAHTTLEAKRNSDGSFPLTVGGTAVTVNGRRAQVFYVSPGEVQFLVPAETEARLAEIIVTNSDGFRSRSTILVGPGAPGIFTRNGETTNEGVILNADTLQNGPFDPSSGNLRLSIFATGVRSAADVSVSIFGRPFPVESVNASPDLPGLDEIHVLVPADFRGTGRVNLTVSAGGRDSNAAELAFVGTATRDVVINEVLADPPDGLAGDSNHDGVRSSSDDEFIELVNHGTAVNLSGWTIRTRASSSSNEITRHVFSSSAFLLSGELIVVFGGGTFDPIDPVFGCARVVDASSGTLSLVNGGLTILIRDSTGNLVTEFTYGGSTELVGDNNQSLTRDPDIVGNFTQHSAAVGANGRRFSPGLKVTGIPFVTCEAPLASISISPLAADLAIGASTQLMALPLDTYGRPVANASLLFSSDNPAVVSIDSVVIDQMTGAGTATVTGHIPGTAHITAQATVGATTIVSPLVVVNVLPPPSLALIVIRQVYGGGNNSGATFQNDFVELFNRGTTTVDFGVTPYSLQYASAAGNFSNANKLNLTAGILAPGQHFLIRLAGGTTNGGPLPSADAFSTSINLSAADGKVALVMGTTLLAGNGCPLNPSVADFVGYGSANCAEGTATAALSATRSARRVSSCVDTNSNSTDFAVVINPPAPNNSATPAVPCP